ncbi:hypothetical protein E0L93_15175 [Rubrobacter taiwanensis]|uniref:Glycosyltransferase RgtA/B/C/D-like domain-containing protein n=1 Tax=Rubrobacter taiwanensis TaxID=185139 RepID=A0A4R1B8K9_9ACTN|nr:glycosyltransferase family 39 protein [Rubrobacter taiwanensis]TCJ13045.1 hypothetical protein E0L93_15175 [Rubrobacter taiwanensis]
MNGGFRFVLGAFLASRALFLAAGALAAALLPRSEPGGEPLETPGILSYWAHWDGAWYSEIALEGYEVRAPESTAFFPLYPMLVRAGAALGGGPALWGVFFSLVFTLLALYFLYRLAETLWSGEAARAATLALAFFPTAFFLNAAYTEALFLALTTGAVWAVRVRRDMLLAGVLGSLAALTRNAGVLVVIPLLYEWYRGRDSFGWRGAAALALPPLGLAAYMAYLRQRFGDPLLFARQQEEYWGREFTAPPETLRAAWQAAGEGLPYLMDPGALFLDPSAAPALAASNALNLAFFGLLAALLAAALLLLPPGLSLYALALTVPPLLVPGPLFPLMSLPRFMLGAFPLFLVLGVLLARSRWLLAAWLAASSAAGVLLAALFASWRWVA